MRKSIKFMALVLALAMCFSAMPMSAFAKNAPCDNYFVCGNDISDSSSLSGLCDECQLALDNQQNGTAGGENKVEVSLTVGETWTVKIPKNIVLQAASKGAEYSVEVSGNIAGTKFISVAPDADFLMSQDGKDDITATITQEKQTVESAEIENGSVVTIPGSIAAPEATSGTWNGKFNFDIELVRPHTGVYFDVQYKDSSSAYGYDIVFNSNGTATMCSTDGNEEIIKINNLVYEDDAIFMNDTGEKLFEISDNGKTIFVVQESIVQESIYLTVDEGSLT